MHSFVHNYRNSVQSLDILLRKPVFLSQSFLQCDYHVDLCKRMFFVARTPQAHVHCMLFSQNAVVSSPMILINIIQEVIN